MKIIECPRDAMQGIKEFIPTKKKIEYINQLLNVGFHTIDFGSFVSEKVIPQLKDTDEVLSGLDLSSSSSKLLSIIANIRGAEDACNFEEINYLGFPLSVSEQFQQRNTNKSIIYALKTVEEIQNLSVKNNKELVVYLSMAFGNPYDENYHPDIVAELTQKLHQLEIKTIALSDTIGVSKPNNIMSLFSTLSTEYPTIEIGAHFHTTADKWEEKVDAAYKNGCRRFDSALKGYGGCPMAEDDLTGNLPTEKLISYFTEDLGLNMKEMEKSLEMSVSVFA
ncbi:MAG: hydroxymethylglutaryl-CoA lyase [Flavobacteriales bacterium]|nr:hydroxymethylglutaryl-CoA lyase [Flavobacteriales bacterium]MDG1719005.1 hydroxymethylglutaryl-CoA lyase [Flavobacteriales bacterium]|tara:strand:- start:67 stop:903 length:837 start_codon:yes stop_codon:yes gene_type:complete